MSPTQPTLEGRDLLINSFFQSQLASARQRMETSQQLLTENSVCICTGGRAGMLIAM